MPKLARYAKRKHVKLLLWCDWHVLNRQLKQAMNEFTKWGIAGIKPDFMDRDDQKAVDFYTRIAKAAAKHHLIIDFHGAFKPTGLSRTYPNIVNREAVMGLEYNKFEPHHDMEDPHHDVMLPFIRMAAGPMDFTPGAMQNYNKEDFRVISSRPMSQGTRCHQLAMYVDYYAPLQMLADAPTAYEKEPPILKLLSAMPVTWDRTVPLKGKVGKYLLLARRKGGTWYIGGMTNWTPRDLSVDLSFLGNGKYAATIYSDAINSDRIGSDYAMNKQQVTASSKLTVHMVPGGGWVAVIKPSH
jgi:alpha-glucosidase